MSGDGLTRGVWRSEDLPEPAAAKPRSEPGTKIRRVGAGTGRAEARTTYGDAEAGGGVT